MIIIKVAAERTEVCWEFKNRLIDFMLNVDYTIRMPVTKTAKRALRGSVRKAKINKVIIFKLEIAARAAKKHPSKDSVQKAISLADKAAKKHTIHKNKAARIKSILSKLLPKTKPSAKSKSSKKKGG